MVDGETITFARQQLCLKSIINKLNLMHKNKLELCAKSIPGPGERDNKTADMFVFLSQARAWEVMVGSTHFDPIPFILMSIFF